MSRTLYRNTLKTTRGEVRKRLGAHSTLDRASPQPLYRQITDRLRAEIEAGRLAAGSRLPSVRELSRDLGVNLVTVVTAYRELIRAGLASGQVGRGTFVRAREAPPDRPEASPAEVPGEAGGRWDPAAVPLSRAAMHLKPLDRNVVALNSGLPSADFFPLVAFRRALEAVLRREGSAALQYQPLEGNGPLRAAIAAYLGGRGTPVRPEDVLICSGAVSGVHIAGRFLAMPGDVLLTETPVYCGFLSAVESLGVKLVGIPLDDEGMRVDVAERLVRQYRPKAIYTIPTYNNPTGVCLSLDRRRALLALSRREGVPIIEEDYANEIGFTGPPPPTLKAMDGAGQIIHVKSFAKLVFPSIRIAAIAAPASMIRGLLGVKEGIDPYASGLNQLILHELLQQPEFTRHAEGLAGRYRPRYEAMRGALRLRAGRHLTWIEPKGGVNVWARLPDGLNSQDLLPEAIEAGVAFTPGRSFVPDRGGEDCLRLSFGNVTPAQIDSGISRLVKVIQRQRARQRRRPLAEPLSASMLL
ncbi:MAG: PLP-dependent aminotransferase family protein [Candidatus Methylomirabilota bacterium]